MLYGSAFKDNACSNTMFQKIIKMYSNCLPPFLIHSVFYSNIAAFTKSSGPNDLLENMISYTTLGIVVGCTYPFSYPLCAGYTLYKKY